MRAVNEMRDQELLFFKYDWHLVVESQKKKMVKHIENMQEADFTDASIDSLAYEIADQYSITIPILKKEDIEVSQREVDIDLADLGDPYSFHSEKRRVKGTAVDVKLPFEGEKEMFFVEPSTYDLNPPRGSVSNHNLNITISGTQLTQEKIKSEIDNFLSAVDRYLAFQAQSIGDLPKTLRSLAHQTLKVRRDKIYSDKNLLSGLGYKVKKP